MSHPGHLQDPPAPIKPTGNAATKTTTTKTATTNAPAAHHRKAENRARVSNRHNLAAYLSRGEVAEMRALGMISVDDERSRIGVVDGYLEAWEQSWEQMGTEAASTPAPADAQGDGDGGEEKEKEKETQQPRRE